MRKLVTFFGVFLALLIVACGPNAENETQYWTNNKESITRHSTNWPGFKTILEEKLKAAEPKWEEANKETDAEKKAEALKAVNASLDPILGKLNEIEQKTKGCESTIEKINKLKLTKSESKDRKDVTSDAWSALDGVSKAMTEATPENEEAAVAICDEQISALIDRQGKLDRAYKRFKPAKTKKKKKKK